MRGLDEPFLLPKFPILKKRGAVKRAGAAEEQKPSVASEEKSSSPQMLGLKPRTDHRGKKLQTRSSVSSSSAGKKHNNRYHTKKFPRPTTRQESTNQKSPKNKKEN